MKSQFTRESKSRASSTSTVTIVAEEEMGKDDKVDFMEDDQFLLWLAEQSEQQPDQLNTGDDNTSYGEDECMDEDDFAVWLARQHRAESDKPQAAADNAQSHLIDAMDDDDFLTWLAQRQGKDRTSLSPDVETVRDDVDETNSAVEDNPSLNASEEHQAGRKRCREPQAILARNPQIKFPHVSLGSYSYNGVQISPKQCVELQNGDFLRLLHIVEDVFTSEITLRGHLFRRTKEMNGILDRKLNEVCWILHVDSDDPRDPLVQSVESRPIAEVLRRRTIRLTNQDFPALSFRQDAGKDSEVTVTERRVLVCRYKYVCYYPNAKARLQYAWTEKGLRRLRAGECDRRVDNNIQDKDLRIAWRGPTQLGGSMDGWLVGEKEHRWREAKLRVGIGGFTSTSDDVTRRQNVGSLLNKWHLAEDDDDDAIRQVSPEIIEIDARIKTTSSSGVLDQHYIGRLTTTYTPSPQPTKKRPFEALDLNLNMSETGRGPSARVAAENGSMSRIENRRYTFGDCFCGAGGMSRGAVDAGLRVAWGFDVDLSSCQSYVKNFFGTPIYNVAADEFASSSRNHYVDILHLSPPCQFFSPLHTKQGKNDEMNTASLFAIFNLLKKTKPRVVTLEQTAGLLRRHPMYFNAVVNMFTFHGFSVRWKLLLCGDYGVPQRRIRLFMIASW